MLEGKCKEDFEKWFPLWEADGMPRSKTMFDQLAFQCKWGVYLEWFDSVGLSIETKFHFGTWDSYISKDKGYTHKLIANQLSCTTRQEAQIEAINKANEIYNG